MRLWRTLSYTKCGVKIYPQFNVYWRLAPTQICQDADGRQPLLVRARMMKRETLFERLSHLVRISIFKTQMAILHCIMLLTSQLTVPVNKTVKRLTGRS
ncbi:hypothetical protein Pan110_40520 [Gimesia panareensis]|nr:hypothetical protein Pan110_40520 [Gimesia panareensis]